jgi:hypothetical protein
MFMSIVSATSGRTTVEEANLPAARPVWARSWELLAVAGLSAMCLARPDTTAATATASFHLRQAAPWAAVRL